MVISYATVEILCGDNKLQKKCLDYVVRRYRISPLNPIDCCGKILQRATPAYCGLIFS